VTGRCLGIRRAGGSFLRRIAGRLAWSAILFGAAVTPACSEQCPLESLAGQITWISGPSKEVSLVRAGQTVTVGATTCILFRDRLDASRVAEVRVVTANGLKVFGRDGTATVWVVPETEAPRSDAWVLLNGVFGGLFRNPPPIGGIGRGGGCLASPEFGDTPRPQATPLQPIAALQPGPQRIEANLPSLVAAWKPGSGGDEQRVQLVRDDGTVLSQRRVCGASSVTLPIAPGMLSPGAGIMLRVGAKNGAPLDYALTVVAPGTLGGNGAGWAYGAWLLASGAPDVKLDALGWIATGSGTSFSAVRILSAVLAEEKF